VDNINHFIPLFQKYNEELLPAKDKHPFLSSAPTRANVEARLKEIYNMADAGRIAKGNNELNSSWEEGTSHLIGALDKLDGLVHEIEGHFYKFQSVTKETSLEKMLAEANKKIEDAEEEHRKDLTNAVETIEKTHKQTIRWHRIELVVALLLFFISFFFGEYKFHIVDHLVQVLSGFVGLVFH
jgi:hypothetical protein